MFKSKTKERRIFTSRKRSRPRRSGLTAIASIVLVVLVLELLTRIFVDLTGEKSQFTAVNSESEITQAYRLEFVPEAKVGEQTDDSMSLKAKPSLGVGYQLLGNQQTPYYQLNAQGFRDRDPVPLAKPKDEVRIFLLGGSAAFGYGIKDNSATISEYLEQRLQQRLEQQRVSPKLYRPDTLPLDPTEKQKYLTKPPKMKPGKYRVINASVPGYASGNELAQIALEILKYKPDLIVILDGYEDLMLSSQQEAIQAPAIDVNQDSQPTSFTDYLTKAFKTVENQSYLAKMARDRWLPTSEPSAIDNFAFNESATKLVQHLPNNSKELETRVQRYLDHQKQILRLSAAAQVPLIIAMQPEITGRNPSQLTEKEGRVVTELGRNYIQQVKDSYPVFIQSTQELAKAFPINLKAVNLYNLGDQYPSPSFIDFIHLNESANQKVAEQMYYAIASMPKMQVVPTPAPQAKSIK